MTNLVNEKGLTLTELMVVLSIIVITAAIAIPMYISDLPRQRTKAVAQGLLADLRMARGRAVANNQSYLICFDGSTATPGYTLRPETGAVMDCKAGTVQKTVDFSRDYSGVQFNVGNSSQPCPGVLNSDVVNFLLNTARFNRLGSSVDGNNSFLDGSVTVTNIKDPNLQAYCLEVEGSTGRVRIYKWDDAQWK
jgi:prepilin-type N-terminal cleavage/methylation domain-containing protein